MGQIFGDDARGFSRSAVNGFLLEPDESSRDRTKSRNVVLFLRRTNGTELYNAYTRPDRCAARRTAKFCPAILRCSRLARVKTEPGFGSSAHSRAAVCGALSTFL